MIECLFLTGRFTFCIEWHEPEEIYGFKVSKPSETFKRFKNREEVFDKFFQRTVQEIFKLMCSYILRKIELTLSSILQNLL